MTIWRGESSLVDPSPLCCRRCDADHHDRGISEDLLQILVVLALVQIVPKFLHRTDRIYLNFETFNNFPLHIDQVSLVSCIRVSEGPY